MGSSQSKTETIYSRYPAESEIYTGIKLTPTVVDRIANRPDISEAPMPDVSAIKAEARQELSEEFNKLAESKLAEAENTIRTELDADYSQKLGEIKAQLETEYYNRLDEIAKMTSNETESVSETIAVQEQAAQQQEEKIREMNLQLDQVEATIKAAHEEADNKIKESKAELERQQAELNQLQRKETEKLMERTKIIFDARLSERPICPDVEKSLAQCYSENPTQSLLCAEITRQYQTCLAEEKERYFQARINHSN